MSFKVLFIILSISNPHYDIKDECNRYNVSCEQLNELDPFDTLIIELIKENIKRQNLPTCPVKLGAWNLKCA